MVECNTDLNENDLELTIVRGIAYNVPNPKEVDTYVKFEFPYPQVIYYIVFMLLQYPCRVSRDQRPLTVGLSATS